MKKIWAVISAAILVIGTGTTDVLAGAAKQCGSYHANCDFIDEDSDGICDNCSNEICGGIGCAYHHAHGGFIDEDNDGICDNCTDGICPQNAVGRSHHHGNSSVIDKSDNRANPKKAIRCGHHNKKGGHHESLFT